MSKNLFPEKSYYLRKYKHVCEGELPSSGNVVITRPGNYFLAQNMLAQKGRVAIVIAANDVTLNLCGFACQTACAKVL